MQTTPQKSRNHFFDLFKIIAIFGVIFIHFEQSYSVSNLITEQQLEFYNLLGYFAVPTFFAISGFFYAKTKNPLKSIQLLVTSFLLASIIFIPFTGGLVEWMANNSLTDLVFEHPKGVGSYWFLWTLALLQILYLIPKKWDFKNVIAILLCVASVSVFVIVYTFGVQDFNYHLDRFLQGIAPFSIGFLISKFSRHLKENNKVFWISLSSTIIIYLFTITNLEYYNSLSLILVVFIILTCTSKELKLPKYFLEMGRNTLWIYILQYFGWMIFAKIGIWGIFEITFVSIAAFSIIILFACDLFARIFSKLIIYLTDYSNAN